MPRKYYYNPETTTPVHDRDLEWDLNKYREYIDSHPYIQSTLNKCAKQGGVRIPSLKATLMAIGACAKGFCTMASQKTLAKKAGVSVRTLQKCIYILREYKIISTKHRYVTDSKKNKRRTSSKTIINAFLKFVDYLHYKATQAKNTASLIRIEIDSFLDRARNTNLPKYRKKSGILTC